MTKLRRFVQQPQLAAALAMVLGTAACDESPADVPEKSELYAIGNLWPSRYVPVCFEIGTDSLFGSGFAQRSSSVANFATFRQWMREAVEDGWGRAANLEFLNWGDCSTRNPVDLAGTVAVFWGDSNWANIGVSSSGWTRMGLTLPPDTSLPSKTAFQKVVRHEMGHALGFQHELLRRDAPHNPGGGTATCDYGGIEDGTTFTPNDATSVLNYSYCQAADAGVLSEWDIVGAQKAYGRKASGSLVGFRGQCVNIASASTAQNAPVIAFPCRNGFNDRWVRGDADQFTAIMVHHFPIFRCMTASGGSVVSQTCNSSASQSFPLVDMEWRGMGKMCAEAVAGSRIEMRNCNGLSTQKWTFHDGNTGTSLRQDQIRSTSTGQCVSTQAGAMGEELVLANCSTTDTRQRFTYPGQGIISAGNFCANIFGGEPRPGSRIGLWNGCTGTPRPYNSQFTLSGQIKNGGQCLDILGGVANPGDAIGTFQCISGAPNQIWDYYL